MSAQEHPPRVAELIERFREIGDTVMRDLPLYNRALEVEALAFKDDGECLTGVVVTPWFMNLIRLPRERAEWNMAEAGRRVRRTLPAGEFDFVTGGDEVVGAFEALSIVSPMTGFRCQASARQAGLEAFAAKMTPPEPEPEEEAKTAAMDRRAFLRGGRG